MKQRISVLGIILVLVALMGCSSGVPGPYDYEDFPWVLDWADLDTLDTSETLTMVYYYNRDFFGTDCAGCQLVNERLFAYGKTNTDNVELILVNARTVMGARPLSLNSQPTVFFMDGDTMTYSVFSAKDILGMLDALEAGTFDFETIQGGTTDEE